MMMVMMMIYWTALLNNQDLKSLLLTMLGPEKREKLGLRNSRLKSLLVASLDDRSFPLISSLIYQYRIHGYGSTARSEPDMIKFCAECVSSGIVLIKFRGEFLDI